VKDFFIRQAISTLFAFLAGLDKNNSEIKKFESFLVPLRDELIELYPVNK
jgi:hypothetical protein